MPTDYDIKWQAEQGCGLVVGDKPTHNSCTTPRVLRCKVLIGTATALVTLRHEVAASKVSVVSRAHNCLAVGGLELGIVKDTLKFHKNARV